MKKSKFTEQQIAFALRQAETATKVEDIIRKLWLLEEENKKLKQMVEDVSLDKAMLQEVIEKRL